MEFPMKKVYVTGLAVVGLLLHASPAWSQEPQEAPKGFYIGGALTQSRFDDSNFSIDDIDDEDNSWKVIGGFRFHEKVSIEANYIDFGEATTPVSASGGPLRAEAKAYSVFAVGYIPVPYVDFIVKIGAARIDSENTTGPLLFEEDDTEFAYGGGVQWRWQNIAVRAEYEKFDTDVIGDLDLISLGATYTFAPR
jgi:OmpA-OmpF porin, OOP family